MAEETAGSMIEMEDRLARDSRGEYKKGLVALISTYAAGVKSAMDEGLPPEEFFSSDHPRLRRFFGTEAPATSETRS